MPILSHIKRITKHSLNYGIGQILTRAIGFFLIPVYTRFLTPNDYGIISIAMVITSVLSLTFQLGQIGALGRFYYDFKENKKKLKEYTGTVILIVFIISLVVTLFLVFLGRGIFDRIAGNIPFYPYIVLVLWTTFLVTFFNFPMSLFQVREKSSKYALFNVLRCIVSTGLIIFFVVYLRQGALGNIRAHFFTAIALFILTWILLRNDILFRIDFKKLKQSLLFGLPLVPHALAGWVLALIDRFFLSHFHDLATVGIYTIGYNMGMIMNLIAMSINFSWVPFFFSVAKEKGDKAKQIFSRLTTYYMMIITFIGLVISILCKEIIILMTTPDYYEAYKIVPIIIGTYVFQGMYFMVVAGIFYIKKTKWLPLATGGAAFLNIVFNYLWIPKYGMMGAAWATLVSFIFIFLFTWIISRRYYPIKYEYKRILKIFLVVGIVYGLSLLVKTDRIGYDIIIKIIMLGLVPLGLWALGFFSKEELEKIRYYLGYVTRFKNRKKETK